MSVLNTIDLTGRPAEGGFFLESAGLVENEPLYSYPLHSHPDSIEILFVRGGRGNLVIGDRKSKVCAGDVVLYREGVSHSVQSDPECPISFYYFRISPGSKEEHLSIRIVPEGAFPIFRVTPGRDSLFFLFPALYLEYAQGMKAGCEVIDHLVASIVRSIARFFGGSTREENDWTEPAEVIERVKLYLRHHYQDDISLDHIADQFSISVSYLCHRFKMRTGLTVFEYLRKARMEEARRLLSKTENRVSMVARLVGFETLNYFYRVFKKETGMTPQDYRLNPSSTH